MPTSEEGSLCASQRLRASGTIVSVERRVEESVSPEGSMTARLKFFSQALRRVFEIGPSRPDFPLQAVSSYREQVCKTV